LRPGYVDGKRKTQQEYNDGIFQILFWLVNYINPVFLFYDVFPLHGDAVEAPSETKEKATNLIWLVKENYHFK
jgi:hypothetical protein